MKQILERIYDILESEDSSRKFKIKSDTITYSISGVTKFRGKKVFMVTTGTFPNALISIEGILELQGIKIYETVLKDTIKAKLKHNSCMIGDYFDTEYYRLSDRLFLPEDYEDREIKSLENLTNENEFFIEKTSKGWYYKPHNEGILETIYQRLKEGKKERYLFEADNFSFITSSISSFINSYFPSEQFFAEEKGTISVSIESLLVKKDLKIYEIFDPSNYDLKILIKDISYFKNKIKVKGKEKTMSKTIGEKISELLSFDHIVEYESDDEYKTIIWGQIYNGFITSDADGETTSRVDLDYFDDDDNPSIKIYKKELKKLEEGDKVLDLGYRDIEKIESNRDKDYYETTYLDRMHISSFAPTWYQEDQETVEIGGRKYNKKEFEEAVKDLKEVE